MVRIVMHCRGVAKAGQVIGRTAMFAWVLMVGHVYGQGVSYSRSPLFSDHRWVLPSATYTPLWSPTQIGGSRWGDPMMTVKTNLTELVTTTLNVVGFAQQYFNFWNGLSGDYRSATISVIQTKDLPLLADWAAQHVPDAVEGEDLPAFQHFDRYSSHRLFFDFADYYGRNVSNEDREQLTALLDRVVVYRAATPTFIPSQRGFEIRQHSGITTYIPQERFVSLNKRYADLAWTQRILIPKP